MLYGIIGGEQANNKDIFWAVEGFDEGADPSGKVYNERFSLTPDEFVHLFGPIYVSIISLLNFC